MQRVGLSLFNRAYQSELAYLRQMGRTFGQTHPGIAGFLSQEGADPDVERMLEGFAFLTAQVRQRAEDCIPEMAHELAELMLPGYVQPLPASTIMQCDIDLQASRGRQTLAAHTPLLARPKDGTACRFRTTHAIDLVPLHLSTTRLLAKHNELWQLEVDFEMPANAADAVFQAGGIRLYCAQAYAQASNLWLALLRHTERLHIDVEGQRHELGADALRCPSFADDTALWPKFAPDTRLVREYFAFAQKFLFIDVTGLDCVMAPTAKSFTLTFHFKQPPALLSPLPQDALRLHCVPAVNLFSQEAIPLRQDGLSTEQLIRADGIDPAHVEVYDVAGVQGIVHARGERRSYPPFTAFKHIGPSGAGRFFKLRRTLSPIDGATDTYLSTQTARRAAVERTEETLSVDLVCTNRLLPNSLQQGDVCTMPTSSAAVTVRNITDVSAPHVPPLGDELYWRLLGHMSAAHQHKLDTTALKQRLHLHNSPQHAGHIAGRVNARRIEGITQLRMDRVYRLVRGVAVAGVQYTLTLQEADCISRGDAYLFARVIAAMLEASQPINTVSSLQLVLAPSMQSYAFGALDEGGQVS